MVSGVNYSWHFKGKTFTSPKNWDTLLHFSRIYSKITDTFLSIGDFFLNQLLRKILSTPEKNAVRVSNSLDLDKAWPRGYKSFSYSTQLSTKFILVINVKMPTIVGISKFSSMINTISERLIKQETSLFVGILVFMSS